MDPRRKPVWENACKWLKELKLRPRRAIDVGCSYGRFAKMMRGAYPKAEIVGLDSDMQSVLTARAYRRLRKGRGILGNVYNLKDPENPVASPKKFYQMEYEDGGIKKYKDLCVILGGDGRKFEEPMIIIEDREKLRWVETDAPKDFDLVTALDVSKTLSLADWGRAMHGKETDDGVPSIGTIAQAAKEGGHILYILPALSHYYGENGKRIRQKSKKFAMNIKKDAEKSGLEFIDWRIVGDVEGYESHREKELDVGVVCRRVDGVK